MYMHDDVRVYMSHSSNRLKFGHLRRHMSHLNLSSFFNLIISTCTCRHFFVSFHSFIISYIHTYEIHTSYMSCHVYIVHGTRHLIFIIIYLIFIYI